MAANLIPGDSTIRAFLKADRRRLPDGAGPAWRFDYARPAGGRDTVSLGANPDTGLALARQKAKQARGRIAAGTDSSA